MKKKILFVITKSNWGGAQRYVFDLVTNLPATGFEVAVALGGRGFLKEKLEKAGIKVIVIPHLVRDVHTFNDLKVFSDLLKIFKEVKPDIIHLNSSKIGGLGSLAGRLSGVPKIIFTAHGWAFNEERFWFSRLIIKIISWFTIILSHRVITVSEAMQKQMSWCPFVSGKIKVIHNAIAPIPFKDKKEARNILLPNNNAEGLWLGTIAELHKNKGLKYVVEAFSLLKKDPLLNQGRSLNLMIIGEGEEKENLHKLIEDKKLTDKVFLLGHQDQASSLLKAFDFFILPSTTEALGYTLLEAGLAQLPVIASKVGGIPEIIEDKKTGLLFQSKNSGEILKSIKYLLKEPQETKLRAEKLKKMVEKQFSLKEMVEKTMKIYI